jgi:hypothetical protein
VVGTSRDSSPLFPHAVLWFGDTTRPAAQLERVRGQKLAGVRRRGLRLRLTMSEPGSTEITLRLARTKTKLATTTVTSQRPGRARSRSGSPARYGAACAR